MGSEYIFLKSRVSEAFLQKQISKFKSKNRFIKKLEKNMEKNTSTKIFDWIDHIVLPNKKETVKRLKQLGFILVNKEAAGGIEVFQQVKTILFPVLLSNKNEIEATEAPPFQAKVQNRPVATVSTSP